MHLLAIAHRTPPQNICQAKLDTFKEPPGESRPLETRPQSKAPHDQANCSLAQGYITDRAPLKNRRALPAPESLIFCADTSVASAGATRCFNF